MLFLTDRRTDQCTDITVLKVIRKFFETITKVLDGISGITKNMNFSNLRACERRNVDSCVFIRMCSGPGGRALVRKPAGMTTT